ncbi:hypothetical protein BDB01DRAFT_840364 [Pilobolus umbonatus]|nr:hypothetical protein BDB01DRAFT_840364 [Pilobolus umbonatus]
MSTKATNLLATGKRILGTLLEDHSSPIRHLSEHDLGPQQVYPISSQGQSITSFILHYPSITSSTASHEQPQARLITSRYRYDQNKTKIRFNDQSGRQRHRVDEIKLNNRSDFYTI